MSTKAGQLRAAVRTRLLDQMIRTVGTPADKWKVLVVDRAALRILAAAIHVNKLVDEGVSIVEMLDMRREPLPRLPAIYFVTPNAESIQQLANEPATQYRSFHLFFTGRVPDFQMQLLRSNPVLLRKLKSLVELNVQFLALESRLFSLDRQAASLPQIYSGNMSESREEMATISERLTEVCKTVAPCIPWTVRGERASTVSRTVASLVKEQLETARLDRSSEASNVQTSADHENDEDQPAKGTLLVIDRVSDLTSPLLHEFSYQAMAHDLLSLDYRKPGGAHVEVDDEKGQGNKKSLQLDDEEKDPIWSNVRSLFIEGALQKTQDAFKEFLETDAAFKIRGKGTGDVDIKDMGAAVRALPDSQARADKYAMHIKAARQCLSECSRLKLTDLALLEQDIAIGRAPDGTRVRAEQIVERTTELLWESAIPAPHRVRLAILALIISEGLPGLGGEHSALAASPTFQSRLLRTKFDAFPGMDSTLTATIKGTRELLKIATKNFEKSGQNRTSRIETEETMTAKLKQRYASRQAQKRSDKANAARHRRHGLKGEIGEHFDVARYHPPLRSVMMDLVDDELDEDEFPYTGAVSVDSIIASMGTSSLESPSDLDDASGSRSKLRKPNLQHHSAAMAGFVKSLTRGDSAQSGGSEDDDGRFRIAERNHLYIVFVIGGVSYSEVRAMYEVCAKREANVLIGGSQILTPNSFADAVAAIADPVVRIRVMLPPLPIELALSRGARAHALGVDASTDNDNKKIPKREHSNTPERSGDGTYRVVDSTGPEQRSDVEVVVGYKKGRGLFGRKKR